MTSPIIETNIERILEDHLSPEIQALESRIKSLLNDVEILEARKQKLLNIAKAANIEV